MKFDIWLTLYFGTLGCYLVHMYGWAAPTPLTLWGLAHV